MPKACSIFSSSGTLLRQPNRWFLLTNYFALVLFYLWIWIDKRRREPRSQGYRFRAGKAGHRSRPPVTNFRMACREVFFALTSVERERLLAYETDGNRLDCVMEEIEQAWDEKHLLKPTKLGMSYTAASLTGS